MNRKYKNNNKNLSEYEHFKLVLAFQEATEDAQRNDIHMQIDILVDELMLNVIHKVQRETGVNYIRPGFAQSLNRLFKDF